MPLILTMLVDSFHALPHPNGLAHRLPRVYRVLHSNFACRIVLNIRRGGKKLGSNATDRVRIGSLSTDLDRSYGVGGESRGMVFVVPDGETSRLSDIGDGEFDPEGRYGGGELRVREEGEEENEHEMDPSRVVEPSCERSFTVECCSPSDV